MHPKKKRKQKYPRFRAFCSAAALTACLLFLGMGFLIADYNTRLLGFGESSLRTDATVKDGEIRIDILGREKDIELSKPMQEWAGRAWALLSPGAHTVVWLYQTECEAVPKLWKWFGL